ncbi:MAG: L,D-transpeptidase, partial [Pseudomonadota bacterium]
GIWFHGLNKPLKPKDTNGCIALENRDINELADYITLHDTPVVISSRIEKVDNDKLKKEAAALEKLIEEWRSAWENKEIGRYMSLYHKEFTAGSKDWKSWRDYKARLAKKYDRIRVEIDNLRILKNDGLVLAEFTQRYSTGGFKSEGKKRIYLKQNSRQWKIIGETFSEGQVQPVQQAVLKKPKISPEDEIRKFLDAWKEAWEKKDLKAYIACYDSEFQSRGMDLGAWESHRQRLNQKYRTLNLDIQGLKISEVSNGEAKVSFRQIYRADKYKDYGIKNILLIKRGNLWKIRTEDWLPMRGKPRT